MNSSALMPGERGVEGKEDEACQSEPGGIPPLSLGAASIETRPGVR